MEKGAGKMLYMVIETFNEGSAAQVYERFSERGRMNPAGLKYIDGWVDNEVTGCFQLMECEDAELFEEWTREWDDLISFEIIPVISSEEAKRKVLPEA
jgi:hypothetical protein